MKAHPKFNNEFDRRSRPNTEPRPPGSRSEYSRKLVLSYSRWCILALASAVMCWGAPAKLVKITVHPERAELRGSKAEQSLLVTAVYSNGIETDVTARAQFRPDRQDLIRISQEGVAVPQQDGKVVVQVTFEGKTAAARLTVLDHAVSRPATFLQDVAPILTQKGCTGSNCHGSVRGQAGFKLSLFGGKPDLDFEEIVKNDDGRRLNVQKPEKSLLLEKPTFQVAHGGGVRFAKGSLEYLALLDWIAGGLKYDTGAPEVQQISVYPVERILIGQGSTQRLIVAGKFSDGSTHDLTKRVRYSSNDENVATVNEDGIVTARRRGETSIMVRGRGKVAVARIAIVPSAPGTDYPAIPANNFVDRLVFAKLKKLGIVPSPVASDEVFLRRAYLDTIGTLPSLEETRLFLASKDPRKRLALADDLLERPEFVDLWALQFADIFQAGQHSGVKNGWQMHRWLRERLRANQPYDQMVRALLQGGGSFVYDDTVGFMGGLWEGPEAMVAKTSQSLLGIRMDCAKCHDHPFESWTQDDFYGMAGFFTRLQFKAESYGLFERSIAVRPDAKPTYDYVNNNKELLYPKTKQPVSMRFLRGDAVELPEGEDPREKLAGWITSPKNPWFSRAVANRIWKHFLGRGIVEPVDDFRVSNPPSNQALLDALASYLVESGYDLRKLMKAILQSRTYQLSASPNATNAEDQINYSRFYIKRQIAEVLFDSMSQAAEARLKIPGFPSGTRAVTVGVGSPDYFFRTFGKTQFREQICERDHTPDVAQAMNLINGETVNGLVNAKKNIIERVLAQADWTQQRRIEEIYLAAESRWPTAEEQAEIESRLRAAGENVRPVYQDLLWAILNSKEFEYIY